MHEGLSGGNEEDNTRLENAGGHTMSRKPAVAGQFYDGTETGLLSLIEQCFVGDLGPGSLPQTRQQRLGRVLGLVCPHAGYIYSGSAAAWAYSALAADGIPDTAVLLGPNHYGLGSAAAITPDDSWSTPLGTLNVDVEAAESILNNSTYAKFDSSAHAREHSIEVQLPFLQYIGGRNTKIVPISIAHLNMADALLLAEDLGSAIAESLSGKSAVIIASTDMTHYESKSSAAAKDSLAIEKIAELDAPGLIELVYSRGITMCGVIGTAVMLTACIRLGAKTARKLTYYSSGDVTGDTDQVVGYGAVSVEK